MEFSLTYRGELKAATKSNKRKVDKHRIREFIHQQLSELWKHYPYSNFYNYHFKEDKGTIKKINGTNFAALICEKKYLTANLAIKILSVDKPGAIIAKSGDIDNRIKTLFDALRSPNDSSELPNEFQPPKEKYFYTLLDDDSLITKCNIATGRLLDIDKTAGNTLVIVDVQIVPINFPLGGLRVDA